MSKNGAVPRGGRRFPRRRGRADGAPRGRTWPWDDAAATDVLRSSSRGQPRPRPRPPRRFAALEAKRDDFLGELVLLGVSGWSGERHGNPNHKLTCLLPFPFNFRATDPAQSRLGKPLKVCFKRHCLNSSPYVSLLLLQLNYFEKMLCKYKSNPLPADKTC